MTTTKAKWVETWKDNWQLQISPRWEALAWTYRSGGEWHWAINADGVDFNELNGNAPTLKEAKKIIEEILT